jgi:protein-S-isoprenylcysteine O-methyltransferase Ste14
MASYVVVAMAAVVYCLVHSLLAMDRTKRTARRVLGDAGYRWYRLAYNVFAVVSAMPLVVRLRLAPDALLWAVPAPAVYLTLALQLAALVAMAHAVMLVGAGDFLGLGVVPPVRSVANPSLVTAGAYRYVRHPLYALGLVVIWLTPVMTTSGLAIAVVFTVYLIVGSYIEESRLLSAYGEEYSQYRRRTPRFLPWPRPPQSR